MTDNSSVMPLYHQVAGLLRQQIAESHYAPGSQLPTEDELCAEFAVSRSTIRQAISKLVAEGFVVRRRGLGTFVGDPVHRVTGPRFQGSFGGGIGEPFNLTVRNVEVQRDHPFPDPVVSTLEMRGNRGTLVTRTRLVDGEPICYSVEYLSDAIELDVSEERLRADPIVEILVDSGIEVHEMVQTIRAGLSGPRVSAELNVDLGSAVLEADALVLDRRGYPVELMRIWYRSDRYEFAARRLLHSHEGPGFQRRRYDEPQASDPPQ